MSPSFTCIADLLKAEQAEDAVVQLHLLLVGLVHLIQNLHQLVPGLGRVSALRLVDSQLMVRALPRAPNPLVLAPRDPEVQRRKAVLQ